MKILHVAAHLGGGVGKAHAAMRAADDNASSHVYALLEKARDRHYLEAVEAAGACVIEEPDPQALQALLAEADITQVEFWNHPRLFAFLARPDLPHGRYLFWCHISGLSPPLIAPGLLEIANAFVFTSGCSLKPGMPPGVSVIGSGFGLDSPPEPTPRSSKLHVGYVGTVDFVKMHPAFFQMIDAVQADDFEVLVYGNLDPEGAAAKAHRAMLKPERVRLMGYAANIAKDYAGLDIFFYPLARTHFGTAENALVEAMSAGLACLVLDNPAETAIIKDGDTGLVAASEQDCVAKLEALISKEELRYRLGRNAAAYATAHYRPENSVEAFDSLYGDMLGGAKAKPAFSGAIGVTPLEWYLSSFPEGGSGSAEKPSKGSLVHFLNCFPEDRALGEHAVATDQAHRDQK